jgi:DNA repair protein RecO (recombination protein O)
LNPNERDVEAIVVGGVDYGEADRVVYLVTRGGRLAAFAHGARISKKRFLGALEPFTTIRATLSESKKRKGGMLTLANAMVERARLPLRRELKTIALASYVAEVAGKVAPEGEPSDGIFDLLRDALDHLCDHDSTLAARRAFELRLIAEIGYRPELEFCVVCGERPVQTFLDLNRGGVLCREHRHNERAPEMGPNTIAWTRDVIEAEAFGTEGGGLDAEGRDKAARKLTGAIAEFFAQLLDRPPSSLSLLEAEQL